MKHTEDIFRKVRSERKWFKNVRLVPSEVPSLPPVADALGFWVKGGPSVPLPRELRTDSKILLSAAKVQVAPEIARKAIEIVAEDSGFDLCELRGFTDSIDLDCDSLLSLVIGNDLLNLGLQIPKNRFGNTVMGKELGQFLKAFISEHGHLLDGC